MSDSGIKLLHAFPKGEHAVAITVFKDKLYVATTARLYYLGENGRLYLVPLAPIAD